MNPLTHFDGKGNAYMVDVSEKKETMRLATASGTIQVSPKVFTAITNKDVSKGDVLSVARIAGIMATKKTSELIPLCHPLALTSAEIQFILDETTYTIQCLCTASLTAKTGVEMEALTGVSVSLLTIYDMCKALDKSMEIKNIHLLEKTGGKSGTYQKSKPNEG